MNVTKSNTKAAAVLACITMSRELNIEISDLIEHRQHTTSAKKLGGIAAALWQKSASVTLAQHQSQPLIGLWLGILRTGALEASSTRRSQLAPRRMKNDVNKVHHHTTIVRVAEDLGEDEDWLLEQRTPSIMLPPLSCWQSSRGAIHELPAVLGSTPTAPPCLAGPQS